MGKTISPVPVLAVGGAHRVRTLLVVHVRYQARSGVRILLVFIMATEFNHKEKILRLTNKLASTFEMGTRVTTFLLIVLPVEHCLIIFDDYHVI